jgi:replicative DNA helicase
MDNDNIQSILDKNKKPVKQKATQPVEYGKIPPQAIELEKAVLGGLMLERDALINVSEFLLPEMFYKPNHQKIYNAILLLDKANDPVDILTVCNKLEQLQDLQVIGGRQTVLELTSGVGSAANIVYHSRVIQEKFIKREQIRIGSELVNLGFDESADVFDSTDKMLAELERSVDIKSMDTSAVGRAKEGRDYITKVMNSGTGLGGASWGYTELDYYTGGAVPGELLVMGGLPGSYKTAISVSLMHNIAAQNIPVLMFQQEMSKVQLHIREAATITGIPIQRLKTGNISPEEFAKYEKCLGLLESRPVFVDTESGINYAYISAVVRRHIREYGVGFVVVDYLQLMEDESGKRTQEQMMDTTVKQLKILAKRNNIPVLLLSSFNDRAYDTQSPPKGNVLKGSRAIGAHADTVILLWNPSKDHPNFVWEDSKGSVHTDNKIGLCFNKNRQGAPGIMWLDVDAATNKFFDYND